MRHVLAAAHNISASLNLTQATATIVREVKTTLDAAVVNLYIVEPGGRYLWTMEEKEDHCSMQVQEVRVQMSEGIVGFVATTGETVHIPDAYSDPRFSFRHDRKETIQTRNILAFPVTTPDGDVSIHIMVWKPKGIWRVGFSRHGLLCIRYDSIRCGCVILFVRYANPCIVVAPP